jgi:hypothetical protein
MTDLIFEKGKYYTIKEIEEAGFKFYKKSTAVIIYKKDNYVYWFDIIEKKGKHQLLSYFPN